MAAELVVVIAAAVILGALSGFTIGVRYAERVTNDDLDRMLTWLRKRGYLTHEEMEHATRAMLTEAIELQETKRAKH